MFNLWSERERVLIRGQEITGMKQGKGLGWKARGVLTPLSPECSSLWKVISLHEYQSRGQELWMYLVIQLIVCTEVVIGQVAAVRLGGGGADWECWWFRVQSSRIQDKQICWWEWLVLGQAKGHWKVKLPSLWMSWLSVYPLGKGRGCWNTLWSPDHGHTGIAGGGDEQIKLEKTLFKKILRMSFYGMSYCWLELAMWDAWSALRRQQV